ncbi:hypothetical protein ACWEPL_22330 [Nonomuraea sp. NPDC004186]
MSRISVERLAAKPSMDASRAPARPANARAMASSAARRSGVRRP